MFSSFKTAAAALFLFITSTTPLLAADPLPRALAYLAAEVPRWSRENHCYACHNNGDAARALYAARFLGLKVAPSVLDDTTRWLGRPEGWDHNGGDGPFSDKRLARVQFSSALADAVRSGALNDRQPLNQAAALLAKDQSADGSWPLDDNGHALGSPAAYGRPLATLRARDVLAAANPPAYRQAIARADAWLLARPISSVFDASIALLSTTDPSRHTLALQRLKEGQGDDGGFGPYATSPSEPFDTALALLGLARLDPTKETRTLILAGRSYLATSQNPDGSWPETTRPAGAESYAQRVSTTAWAVLALLATRDLER